ncbi:uncharacterized protein LOC116266228 [Nymphaea colorata]|nr:uncharacterized protein LOC116266228 [Nymphaea colorata]XP_031503215.1 uncharacterized protein LOC116266228 [Nymphaea colorata]XP_049936973.1 uncharacterized protein LOC116266228 [Nymphaea colorata]
MTPEEEVVLQVSLMLLTLLLRKKLVRDKIVHPQKSAVRPNKNVIRPQKSIVHPHRSIAHPYKNAGEKFVYNVIHGPPKNCLNLLRMDKDIYVALCNALKNRNLLHDARDISVEEQVAIFLYSVGHNKRNRASQDTFQHSGQTISKYFNVVLRTICHLGKDYICRLNNDTPAKIQNDPRFYPYFKDCLGVIDSTHVPVWVPTSTHGRFRNRKGVLSQNVMAVVGFDMRFHYVMAGWEGSAEDSRVLYSALDDNVDPLQIPEGKYYLADGDYPSIVGLITPYCGHQYHMSELNASGSQPITTAEELFNNRHFSLRATVERVFGLLRSRFPILKSQVEYPFSTQVQIVLATCVLHNFILDHNPNATQFDVEDGASYDVDTSSEIDNEHEFKVQVVKRGSNDSLRATIAAQMFEDFNNRCRR